MTSQLSSKAHVLTVLNLKGGVGKTHATWLLAGVCQDRGKRVLLVDTDTQGNLTTSFLEDQSPAPGIERLLHPGSDGDFTSLIRRTRYSHIDFVPSSPAVAPYDLSNQADWEKSDLHLSFLHPVASVRSQYDYIIFDCPPRLSLVSFAALCASDGIICPMEAADWGALGILQVTEAVEYVKKHYNARLELLGYLVSRFKKARSLQKSYLRQLRAHFGPLAFDAVIPDLAGFEKSVTNRTPITLLEPRGRAAGIARAFFDEVSARLAAGGPDRDGPSRPAVVRRKARPVAAAAR
jgi:chromosome partitioning protein